MDDGRPLQLRKNQQQDEGGELLQQHLTALNQLDAAATAAPKLTATQHHQEREGHRQDLLQPQGHQDHAHMQNNNPPAHVNDQMSLNQLTAAYAQQAMYQQQLYQFQMDANNISNLHTMHNLIPQHLQLNTATASLHGTPGHPSALIDSSLSMMMMLQQNSNALAAVVAQQQQKGLTVQDRLFTQPVYNGINPNYPGLRVLNTHPPIFAVDQFLSSAECQFLIQSAQDSFTPAPVVGAGNGELSRSRTSSTCYLAREDLPNLMRKILLLTGKPTDHCELPQVGRYMPSQQYLQHFDAFDLGTADGQRFAKNGGQRTITVLIYLNNVARGGHTRFPALNLEVQPQEGTALVFFPSSVDGALDKMALHAALPAIDVKFVSQIWIRQSTYQGLPSKRLPVPMGVP